MQLNYLIEYVADMDRALAFYRDVMHLPLRFQTPEWTEFDTGSTTLALHIANAAHAPGTFEPAFGVPDIHQFYGEATAQGAVFVQPPTAQEFGTLAVIQDADGARLSVARMGK